MRRDYKRISMPPKAFWPVAGLVLIILITTVFLLAMRWW